MEKYLHYRRPYLSNSTYLNDERKIQRHVVKRDLFGERYDIFFLINLAFRSLEVILDPKTRSRGCSHRNPSSRTPDLSVVRRK